MILLGINCSTKDDDFNLVDLKNKLVGKWIEVSLCDSCHTITIDENDVIYIDTKWDNPTLSMSYQVIAEDSIKVIRNWEIESEKKTTTHSFVFYTNDTLEIKQFMAVDYGVAGFEDIKLYKSK